MKKLSISLLILLFSISIHALPLKFSGSAGCLLYFANEKVGKESIEMKHRAAGPVANFFATFPVGLGAYLRTGYYVPYYYYISQPEGLGNSGEEDLTYVYTQIVDFAAGISYVFQKLERFDFTFALGYNFSERILAPAIGYLHGLTLDIGARCKFFETLTLSFGIVGNWNFMLQMASANSLYDRRHEYSLFSVAPYLSVGFLAGTKDSF